MFCFLSFGYGHHFFGILERSIVEVSYLEVHHKKAWSLGVFKPIHEGWRNYNAQIRVNCCEWQRISIIISWANGEMNRVKWFWNSTWRICCRCFLMFCFFHSGTLKQVVSSFVFGGRYVTLKPLGILHSQLIGRCFFFVPDVRGHQGHKGVGRINLDQLSRLLGNNVSQKNHVSNTWLDLNESYLH